MKNVRKGFTLIELLVVIAIIGILSAVVLASLNNARSKGSDAAIKSSINNARAQAELYYDSNGLAYDAGTDGGTDDMCTDTDGVGTPAVKGVDDLLDSATAAGSTDIDCFADETSYAISANLKSSTGQYYCVDSTGQAKTNTAAQTDTTC